MLKHPFVGFDPIGNIVSNVFQVYRSIVTPFWGEPPPCEADVGLQKRVSVARFSRPEAPLGGSSHGS